MEYLLKANAIIILFYLCYKLFLQGETFFESNRYFLLTGLAIASIIPFIVIPIYVTVTPVLNDFNFATTEHAMQVNEIEHSFNFIQLLQWFYLTGIVVFTIKFLIEFSGLLLILMQNNRTKKGRYTYVETKKDHSPFSFFKYIVYNPSHFNVMELEHIILHEKVHAKQYHSIDIIITKITAILFWFNPFIWLYNKSLQQNLEFIADSNTQQKITDAKSYQTLLLKTVLSTKQITLVNNFYNSLIKKRIIMLHKSKSKQLNLWKYTLILPLLALFLMSFNTKEVYIAEEIKTSKSSPIAEPKEDIEAVIITKNSSKQDLENAKEQFSKLDVNLKFKGIKRNSNGEITAIKASFKSPEGNKGNYNVFRDSGINAFKFYYNSTNGEVGFSKVADNTFIVKGEPNENVYIYSTDDNKKGTYKIKKSSKTTKGYSYSKGGNTEDVKVTVKGKPTKIVKGENVFIYSTDDKDDEEGEELEVIVKRKPSIGTISFNTDIDSKNYKLRKSSNKNSVYIYSTDDKDIEEEEIIVKEKPIKEKKGTVYIYKDSDEDNDDDTEDVFIIKEGKTKVVKGSNIINTWKEENDDENHIIDLKQDGHKIVLRTSKGSKKPIYIKDGKIISHEELNNMTPNSIKSVNVLKGDNAVNLYGAKAEDGAIVISTKDIGNTKDLILVEKVENINKGEVEKLVFKGNIDGKEPLYILDGKEISKSELDKIYSVNTVAGMNVLKGKKATKKYGKKGENGVVEITTKK